MGLGRVVEWMRKGFRERGRGRQLKIVRCVGLEVLVGTWYLVCVLLDWLNLDLDLVMEWHFDFGEGGS